MEETPNPAIVSRKIVSIAAGEAHTLALTGDGKVYSWGRGFFGRLGTGSEEDRLFPVRVFFHGPDDESEDKINIVGIASGSYHSLALADDGSLWGWGYNIYGQIDANAGENYSTPHLFEGLLETASTQNTDTSRKPLKISSVGSGGMMSVAVDDAGDLWMWGNFPSPPQSQPSEEESSFSSVPFPVRDFHGRTVVKVACGNEHVVALVSAREQSKDNDLICYSWGSNGHGQLGLGDGENRFHPVALETFDLDSPWEVYDIACGSSHTALLAKRKRPTASSESVCWTFGLGENGQLGHGTTQTLVTPEPVKGLPENVSLVSLDCGLYHTSVTSSAGEVWSWGMEKGLGLCPDARFTGTEAGDALTPVLIPFSGLHDHKFPEPLQVACGAAHTVLLADAGEKLWAWGRGRSGVLGNGRAVDCYAPTVVLWPLITDSSSKEELEESNKPAVNDVDKKENREEEKSVEMEKGLAAAMEEIKLLQSKLSMMERYAGILHGAVFGKPMVDHEILASFETSGSFDIAKEWESMLESSDERKLVRLQMFYRDMLSGVKDKLMKRRIKDIVKECMNAQS